LDDELAGLNNVGADRARALANYYGASNSSNPSGLDPELLPPPTVVIPIKARIMPFAKDTVSASIKEANERWRPFGIQFELIEKKEYNSGLFSNIAEGLLRCNYVVNIDAVNQRNLTLLGIDISDLVYRGQRSNNIDDPYKWISLHWPSQASESLINGDSDPSVIYVFFVASVGDYPGGLPSKKLPLTGFAPTRGHAIMSTVVRERRNQGQTELVKPFNSGLAHELGHVLGLEHDFRGDWTGIMIMNYTATQMAGLEPVGTRLSKEEIKRARASPYVDGASSK
jgi:hypothetical protein